MKRSPLLPQLGITFQEAVLAAQESDPTCVSRPEWWERDYVRLVLTHMHQLNAQQSPRSTLGMIEDALKIAKELRGPVLKAKREEPDAQVLKSIFNGLALKEVE